MISSSRRTTTSRISARSAPSPWAMRSVSPTWTASRTTTRFLPLRIQRPHRCGGRGAQRPRPGAVHLHLRWRDPASSSSVTEAIEDILGFHSRTPAPETPGVGDLFLWGRNLSDIFASLDATSPKGVRPWQAVRAKPLRHDRAPLRRQNRPSLSHDMREMRPGSLTLSLTALTRYRRLCFSRRGIT